MEGRYATRTQRNHREVDRSVSGRFTPPCAVSERPHGHVWFNHRWQGSIQTAGLWLYAGFDFNATEQSRIKDAFGQWNAQPPTLWFNYKGLGTFPLSCPGNTGGGPRNRNPVEWSALPNPTIARTIPCFESDGNEMDHFIILVDPDVAWYTGGSAGAIDDNQNDFEVDFWAALTHEYGHALGFRPLGEVFDPPGHFMFDSGSSNPCPGLSEPAHSTLCDDVTVELPSTYFRTLWTHDTHTFDAAY